MLQAGHEMGATKHERGGKQGDQAWAVAGHFITNLVKQPLDGNHCGPHTVEPRTFCSALG